MLSNPEKAFKKLELDEKTFTLLVENIRKKMTPNPVKVRSDFEISCFTYEGIDAIRNTLMQAK